MSILVILGVFLVTSCSYTPDIRDAHLSMYNKAYDYIISDTMNLKQSISVADTIVFIESTLFWENIKIQSEKPEATISRLDSIDNVRKFDNFYSLQLSRLFKKNTSSTLTIYFSKIFNDSLIAEVIDNKGLSKASYDRVTMFNTGCRYLFIFDKSGHIKRVFKKSINYN